MLRRASLLIFMLALSGCLPSAQGWKGFAACAAAYRANAQLADPGRAASMIAMVSEVADEYLAAARARNPKAEEVEAFVSGRLNHFKGQSREAVERFIESCPQIELEDPA